VVLHQFGNVDPMELEEYAKQREAERAIFEKVMRPDRTADVLRAIMESDDQILTKLINDGLVVMTENAALTVTEKGLQRSKRTTPIKQRCSTKWRGRTSARSSRGARRGIKTQRHTDTNSGPAGISGRARVT
jgi:hypothetical protein